MGWQEHPLWPALRVDEGRWAELSPRMRAAVLRLFESSPARSAGVDLGRLVATPWWSQLDDDDDRIRAVKIIAYVSAASEGARTAEGPVCRRRILVNTLDSLLSAAPRFALRFEGLPVGEGELVAGLRRAPGTVVLNRRAIAADDRRLGEGSAQERRVGTCTLVHEVNHLCNPTPVGPTYAAFMDEYRAWMVDFVAFAGRAPRAVEGRQRCRQLLTGPRYAAVGRLVERRGEREAVASFLRRFGADVTVAGAGQGVGEDFEAAAPLPDPRGNLDNGPAS
ncbi:MAG: hypothetical protein AB1Z98_28895 [Nannocystaceae bacterium]